MKQIYPYCWASENFGDQPMNDFIWPRLFPWLNSSGTPDTILMGIGSILGHHSEMSPRLKNLPWIVFGSGFQYGKLELPEDVTVFAVRGPQTLARMVSAGKIMAPQPPAFGDPAVLLPLLYPRTKWPRETVGRIVPYNFGGNIEPHWFKASAMDFKRFMERMWNYERIECDCMHAAIVADAYGIPWRPLRFEAKWVDHLGGLGIHQRKDEFQLSDRGLLAQMQTGLLMAKSHLEKYLGVHS